MITKVLFATNNKLHMSIVTMATKVQYACSRRGTISKSSGLCQRGGGGGNNQEGCSGWGTHFFFPPACTLCSYVAQSVWAGVELGSDGGSPLEDVRMLRRIRWWPCLFESYFPALSLTHTDECLAELHPTHFSEHNFSTEIQEIAA